MIERRSRIPYRALQRFRFRIKAQKAPARVPHYVPFGSDGSTLKE
jgi:hypothetical protein